MKKTNLATEATFRRFVTLYASKMDLNYLRNVLMEQLYGVSAYDIGLFHSKSRSYSTLKSSSKAYLLNAKHYQQVAAYHLIESLMADQQDTMYLEAVRIWSLINKTDEPQFIAELEPLVTAELQRRGLEPPQA